MLSFCQKGFSSEPTAIEFLSYSLELSRVQISVPGHGEGMNHAEARHIKLEIHPRLAVSELQRVPSDIAL
jgi:hypothetical protein